MSGYIGTQPVPQATQTRDVFTATSGQTTFATSGYTPNFLDCWLNGVKLVNGDDFTATNGSDVVLTSGATAGDTVEVLSYSTFEVNSQTFTGTTTLTGDLQATTATFSGAVTGTSATLSGGVYLGGTGAANLLDDYEEGTFTAQMFDASSGGNASSSTSTGRYTKIGQLVFATFSISNVDTSGLTAGNDAYFALPFANNGGVVSVGSVRLYADVDDTTVSLASQVLSGHDRVSIVRSRDNTGLAEVLVSQFVSGASDMSISIVYHT